MTKAVVVSSELSEVLAEMLAKYEDLVWYARSHPASSIHFWQKVPKDIRDGAFEAQMKVEEDYPDEVVNLRSEGSDWYHGFNSGMLAAIRFFETASMEPETIEDPEGSWTYGGVKDALEFFPDFST